MNIVKKRNPDKQDNGPTNPPSIPSVPELRTFIVNSGQVTQRNVEAHGLAVDESRMLSFFVFFMVDGQPAQAPKLFVNSDSWDTVEEINALFPVLLKH